MKDYYILNNVGRAKYLLCFHDGEKKHEDGSKFYDIIVYRNKEALNESIKDLESQGYNERFRETGRMTDTTIVKNIITNEEMVYVNDKDTVQNMVNAIIAQRRQYSNLLSSTLRNEIIAKYNLQERISRNEKDYICYCEELDLIARRSIND